MAAVRRRGTGRALPALQSPLSPGSPPGLSDFSIRRRAERVLNLSLFHHEIVNCMSTGSGRLPRVSAPPGAADPCPRVTSHVDSRMGSPRVAGGEGEGRSREVAQREFEAPDHVVRQHRQVLAQAPQDLCLLI